jgi:hypothetical protein
MSLAWTEPLLSFFPINIMLWPDNFQYYSLQNFRWGLCRCFFKNLDRRVWMDCGLDLSWRSHNSLPFASSSSSRTFSKLQGEHGIFSMMILMPFFIKCLINNDLKSSYDQCSLSWFCLTLPFVLSVCLTQDAVGLGSCSQGGCLVIWLLRPRYDGLTRRGISGSQTISYSAGRLIRKEERTSRLRPPN